MGPDSGFGAANKKPLGEPRRLRLKAAYDSEVVVHADLGGVHVDEVAIKAKAAACDEIGVDVKEQVFSLDAPLRSEHPFDTTANRPTLLLYCCRTRSSPGRGSTVGD